MTRLVRDWAPPVLARWADRRMRRTNHFKGPYDSWTEARLSSTGYEAELILGKVLDATLEVTRGEAAFERDSVAFTEPSYEWPVLTGLLSAALNSGGRLSVLDFGGSLGSSYFQSRDFLKALPHLTWSVVEQPHFVKSGEKHIQNETLRFYPTISACLSDQSPNVVLLSSVLQYLEDPFALLTEVSNISAETLIVDRTIVNRGANARIYVQHVPDTIYSASYPVRSLSESALIDTLKINYRLISDFYSPLFPGVAAINSLFKGYIFKMNSLDRSLDKTVAT